jgi:hypothetical protein
MSEELIKLVTDKAQLVLKQRLNVFAFENKI